MRGVDLNHRPLGYEPKSRVRRGRSAWLTAFIFSESLTPNYPDSPRDGHNFGHSCSDIAHYPKPAVADWQRRYRRLFELAELKKPTGTRKRCFPHMFRDTFAIEMLWQSHRPSDPERPELPKQWLLADCEVANLERAQQNRDLLQRHAGKPSHPGVRTLGHWNHNP